MGEGEAPLCLGGNSSPEAEGPPLGTCSFTVFITPHLYKSARVNPPTQDVERIGSMAYSSPEGVASQAKKSAAVVIILTNICLQVTVVSALVCGPTFQRLFHLSKTELGICLGAANGGYLVVGFIIGHITRRWGSFPVLLIGLISIMFGVTLVILAPSFLMLLGGLVWIGISAAFIVNANATFLADLFPDNLRRVMALGSGLWFAASALFAPVIGALLKVARYRNWGSESIRVPYLFNLLFTGTCLLLVWRVVQRVAKLTAIKERKAPLSDQKLKGMNSISSHKRWLWIPVLGFFHGLMYDSLTAWVNPMVQDKFGGNDFSGGLLYGMIAFNIAVGRLNLARAKLVVDDRIILALSAITGATLFGLGLVAPTYGVTAALMALGGLAVGATYPCILSLVGTNFPQNKAVIYGYTAAGIAMSGLLGPSLVGILADRGVSLWWALGISPLGGLILGFSSLLWWSRDH